MGFHRTFLFLLVVGLIIAAFRRGGGVSSPDTRPTAPALTNSTASRALASGLDSGK